MQESEWQKSKTSLAKSTVSFATKNRDLIKVDIKEVQNIELSEKKFKDKNKKILAIEHIDEDKMTVLTYIYAPERSLSALSQFVGREYEKKVESEIDLSQKEEQVIMALYSGVSPFEIPEFIDAKDVEEVEEIYKELIDLGVLEEVRKRSNFDNKR